ncbi:hypothetical protein AB0451_34665 [Streptomyces sp. NPDC052000]|uniref:hypothetical protein n=1 Tax=Streptomyces sp. NPDC052000 TaxID=3155676 RepID=UPI00344FDB12
MTNHVVLILVLTLIMLVVVAALAAVFGYGIARWGGAPVPDAINRGGIVFASTMMMGIALLAALLPLLKVTPS